MHAEAPLAVVQNLDFDFDKCCSVSLSKVNVYVCLVCGSYFQGRGPGTHAHTHSVEEGHHLIMSLETGRVFCVPDNYEVVDRSLKDIQHVLNPLYTKEEISQLGSISWARTLDGSDYMPGLLGMNNMKRNDYLNVVLHTLLRVDALRCAAGSVAPAERLPVVLQGARQGGAVLWLLCLNAA